MSEVPARARLPLVPAPAREGRCTATWKREFKLPWREAGPPNHHDDKVDSDQQVVNKGRARLQLALAPAGGKSVYYSHSRNSCPVLGFDICTRKSTL